MKIRMEVSEKQAICLIAALDLYSRIGIGQIDELDHLARCGFIVPAADIDPSDVRDQMRPLCDAIKRLLGHPVNGSFGIGHALVHEDAQRAFEMKKQIDKAVSVARDPAPNFRGVNYDGRIVRYTTDADIQIEVLGDTKPDARLDALRKQQSKWWASVGTAIASSMPIPTASDVSLVPAPAPQTSAEFALRALVAAGHVSQELVDQAMRLPGAPVTDAVSPTLSGASVSPQMAAPAAVDDEPVAFFDEALGRPVLAAGAPMLLDQQPLYTRPQPSPGDGAGQATNTKQPKE